MDIQRTGFSAAARLGIVLSIIGVGVALMVGSVSQTTQTVLTLSMMLIAFVGSLVITGRRQQSPQRTGFPVASISDHTPAAA